MARQPSHATSTATTSVATVNPKNTRTTPLTAVSEGGEWEQETEKGGEVELEQFWLQKTFAPWANLRVGHIVVPVGLNNAHHEPTNFFTVYRPEGENTIMPSTWHQTGISFWGRYGKFRYEAQLLAGLNADNFTNVGWIKKGHKSPMEFDVANKYATAVRIDNYSVPGLRIGSPTTPTTGLFADRLTTAIWAVPNS